MKIKKYIFLLLIFALNSCAVNGDFKGLYSYYNTTKKENPQLFIQPKTTGPICNITPTAEPKIIITNGVAIKNCLLQYDDAVVYIWSPKCESANCIALNALQRECKNRNIELFVVAEYYDSGKMLETYAITRPIFGIDIKYYKTSLTSKYISKFVYDLDGTRKMEDRFLRFKNGQFVHSTNRFETM